MTVRSLVLGVILVSAPAAAGKLGKPSAGLAISVNVGGAKLAEKDPLKATITLKNVSKKTLTVLSHTDIGVGDPDYDWFTVRLTYPVPSDEGCASVWAGSRERVVRFIRGRDKSIQREKKLAPGATLTHVIDLSAWALAMSNPPEPITPGFYKIEVEYTVQNRKGVWNGTIRSPRERFQIDGVIPSDKCPTNPGWDRF